MNWEKIRSVQEWLNEQLHDSWKQVFEEQGILVINGLLDEKELKVYQDLYDKFLTGKIDASAHRHDLGNHIERQTATENICQIMWPTVYVPELEQGPLHQRVVAVSKILLGDDMAFDYDMMISKAAHSNTETPWHQDESYWLDMPDKRAVSCWVAMEETTLENGCMWFVPGSHREAKLRESRTVTPDVHVRVCDVAEGEGQPYPLQPGSVTIHGGRTLHYSRGNSTGGARRGFIVNCRPAAMVDYELMHNIDHGKRGVNSIFEADKVLYG